MSLGRSRSKSRPTHLANISAPLQNPSVGVLQPPSAHLSSASRNFSYSSPSMPTRFHAEATVSVPPVPAWAERTSSLRECRSRPPLPTTITGDDSTSRTPSSDSALSSGQASSAPTVASTTTISTSATSYTGGPSVKHDSPSPQAAPLHVSSARETLHLMMSSGANNLQACTSLPSFSPAPRQLPVPVSITAPIPLPISGATPVQHKKSKWKSRKDEEQPLTRKHRHRQPLPPEQPLVLPDIDDMLSQGPRFSVNTVMRQVVDAAKHVDRPLTPPPEDEEENSATQDPLLAQASSLIAAATTSKGPVKRRRFVPAGIFGRAKSKTTQPDKEKDKDRHKDKSFNFATKPNQSRQGIENIPEIESQPQPSSKVQSNRLKKAKPQTVRTSNDLPRPTHPSKTRNRSSSLPSELWPTRPIVPPTRPGAAPMHPVIADLPVDRRRRQRHLRSESNERTSADRIDEWRSEVLGTSKPASNHPFATADNPVTPVSLLSNHQTRVPRAQDVFGTVPRAPLAPTQIARSEKIIATMPATTPLPSRSIQHQMPPPLQSAANFTTRRVPLNQIDPTTHNVNHLLNQHDIAMDEETPYGGLDLEQRSAAAPLCMPSHSLQQSKDLVQHNPASSANAVVVPGPPTPPPSPPIGRQIRAASIDSLLDPYLHPKTDDDDYEEDSGTDFYEPGNGDSKNNSRGDADDNDDGDDDEERDNQSGSLRSEFSSLSSAAGRNLFFTPPPPTQRYLHDLPATMSVAVVTKTTAQVGVRRTGSLVRNPSLTRAKFSIKAGSSATSSLYGPSHD